MMFHVKQFKELTNHISKSIINSAEYCAFISSLKKNQNTTIKNIDGSFFAFFLHTLIQKDINNILVITENEDELENIRDDLDFITGENIISFLPDPESNNDSFDNEINSFFINSTIKKINANKKNIVVSTIKGLDSIFTKPDYAKKNQFILKTNSEIDRDHFLKLLNDFGFNREDTVVYPLDYSVKGSIIDFFSPERINPLRVEFFGDTIESIRSFDIEDQISIKHHDVITLVPPANSKLEKENSTSIFDIVYNDTHVFLYNTEKIEEVFQERLEKENLLNKFKIIKIMHLLEAEIDFNCKSNNFPKNNFSGLKVHFQKLLKNPKQQLFVICENNSQTERISQLINIPNIQYISGSISTNFECEKYGINVFPDYELFSKSRQSKSFRNLPKDFNVEKFDINKIEPGDIMVHIDYGIGAFVGLEIIKAFNTKKECLILEYSGGSKIFVPLEKISTVKKYSSSDGFIPKITKLNSGEWERTKLRTKKSLEKISKELMELYAKRMTSTGFSFEADNDLQFEMEMEFPWEETPDQRTVTEEIKKDMEKPKPMDRLLCGDVGFGKTEIAIRSAFKAVNNSKQVVVLVPTTILADQHYKSFIGRLEKYPVKIAMLSRFVTKKKQKDIITSIGNGDVDIVISTIRILSKDIKFKDLGLLIIDEEHHFGVKQKEYIKQLRKNVDILSLTATPIPRTLHFSLIGARDYSQINTPPKFRLPILTELIEFKEDIIKKAITREMRRNGQVYFVHNEIQSIKTITLKLMELFPNLNINYVHGQMKERELEPKMNDFINHKTDILVTTAIIESGIDIPNVNTIFINRSNRFGLAQLYQLRGRVGRTNRRAYCYLIVPKMRKLKPDAIKRLKTIKRYTSLGSGYNIALKDLEIRGAGNVFGIEQKGNIQSIGYELYTQMLKETLEEIKENEIIKTEEEKTSKKLSQICEILSPHPSFFTEKYIESQSIRLRFYRRLSEAKNIKDLNKLNSELEDRYGKMDKYGIRLINIIGNKILAETIGINKIEHKHDYIKLFFSNENKFNSIEEMFNIINTTIKTLKLKYKFIPSENFQLIIYLKELEQEKRLNEFLYILNSKINL